MTEIALVLFGMPRKIAPFLESITNTLLRPMHAMGVQYRVVGQLNAPDWVSNPRSNEDGQIDHPEKLTAMFPEVEIKRQDDAAISQNLSRVSAFGDSWSDNFRSLSNLLHQQMSLTNATNLALATPATHFIFLRPDLVYHDDFTALLDHFVANRAPSVSLPGWQSSTGLNDRFAFVTGPNAAAAYGFRLQDADRFMQRRGRPLHSERLLAYSLGTRGFSVKFLPHRASRCRIDGMLHSESFALKLRVTLRTQLRLRLFPDSYA